MIRSPGPWQVGPRVHENMLYAVYDANGSLVVNLGDGGKGIVEQRGNAFAIGAVIDLLAAAVEAREVLAVVTKLGRPAQGGEQAGNLECCEIALKRLQDAIKKATTETKVEGVEKPKSKLKEPDLIVAVVCENGRVYGDGGGPAVFTGDYRDGMPAMVMAMEHLEGIRCSGNDGFCKCNDHRVVQYVPNV